MRNKNQQLARQWSRMWPEDRAMSKALHQTDIAGGQVAGLAVLVGRALKRAEEVRKKRGEKR